MANLSLHFPANSFETLVDDETPATSAAVFARMGGESLFSAIGGAETGSISPCSMGGASNKHAVVNLSGE